MRKLLVWLMIALADPAGAVSFGEPARIPGVEATFLDFLNAGDALRYIDSGAVAEYQGRDRAAWAALFATHQAALEAGLSALDESKLGDDDRRAVAAIRRSLAGYAEPAAAEGAAHEPICADANRTDLRYEPLKAALVACFTEFGGNLEFEGRTIDRGTALNLLHEIEEPERRKALFDAFGPLWRAINGNNEPTSPYRRMIRLAAEDAAKNGSEFDRAAKALGVTVADIERWLVRVLLAWAESTRDAGLDPWDYRYAIGAANRALARHIPADRLPAINERFFRDLNFDVRLFDVVFDFADRPGKSPLAYCDFLSRGRRFGDMWIPSRARIVGSYPEGGLFSLNELVHETGHAANIGLIETRPAFMDWPDSLFAEAFADVPSWSVFESAWQEKYLGASVDERDSLRSLYGLVVLDVAWSLFELRMLRDPATDPNYAWANITHAYLGITKHPEQPWWALRVQLVDSPGYMVNYGIGAVLTAEMRKAARAKIGSLDTGTPLWTGFFGHGPLRRGSERSTRELMEQQLGRPAKPDALLKEIRRIQ
ncbi:MAG: hypothetical protein ACT4UP_00905 [Gammaproteobacteria bacterium]